MPTCVSLLDKMRKKVTGNRFLQRGLVI